MIERQKEALLISFLNEKEKYLKLAEYIVHLIKDDPASPEDSFHTIIYRIKDELRIIEKVDKQNEAIEAGAAPITEENYQSRVGDLLGVRIICLRLSDIEKIKAYLQLLSEEKILRFISGPDQKRSFILPVNPGESIAGDIDLTYSGYSSIHYQMALGRNSGAPPGLENLQFEFQLRTILEEAWGEIDHKYRYLLSRNDGAFPEYIHTGFYNLSAYLQVAALQAEYLCRLAESYSLKKSASVKGEPSSFPVNDDGSVHADTNEGNRLSYLPALETHLQNIFGVRVTPRTLNYIAKRLEKVSNEENTLMTLEKMLTRERVHEFMAIFCELYDHKPFNSEKEKNIDVINALNFAVFSELQGRRIAQEGLRSVLRWRKERSICQTNDAT